jgi:isocitrate dehydrogenase
MVLKIRNLNRHIRIQLIEYSNQNPIREPYQTPKKDKQPKIIQLHIYLISFDGVLKSIDKYKISDDKYEAH